MAFAQEMAKRTNGLVLDGLMYFYPGTTQVGRSTVHVSTEEGKHYLRAIADSLLRQGFRRQVYLSMHGPSHMTIAPMIIEFFHENSVPILYMDMVTVMSKIGPQLREKHPEIGMGWMEFGAYGYLGLEDRIPLDLGTPDVPQTHSPLDQYIQDLIWAPTSAFSGFYYGELSDHGAIKKITAEERHQKCEEYKKYYEYVVDEIDICKVVDSLQKVDQYISTSATRAISSKSFSVTWAVRPRNTANWAAGQNMRCRTVPSLRWGDDTIQKAERRFSGAFLLPGAVKPQRGPLPMTGRGPERFDQTRYLIRMRNMSRTLARSLWRSSLPLWSASRIGVTVESSMLPGAIQLRPAWAGAPPGQLLPPPQYGINSAEYIARQNGRVKLLHVAAFTQERDPNAPIIRSDNTAVWPPQKPTAASG